MTDKNSVDKLFDALQERAKELNCLYRIEEAINTPNATVDDVIKNTLTAIPPGWQYVDICTVKITIEDHIYTSENFKDSEWVLNTDIKIQEKIIGSIEIYYTEKRPNADVGPFLKEEVKLARTIADRIGNFLLHIQMKEVFQGINSAKKDLADERRGEWRVILDLLKQTDKSLYISISQKMLNHLCWTGVKEAEDLLKKTSNIYKSEDIDLLQESNVPYKKKGISFPIDLSKEVFMIASNNLNNEELLHLIQKWVQEDKLSFLIQVINRNLPLSEVADAIRRYYHTMTEEEIFQTPNEKGITVSLVRRFLSDQLEYLNISKDYITISDFFDLIRHLIFANESHGKLGGKSAGMFLASRIIKKQAKENKELGQVKVPKTWYITSDMTLHFMHYNNLEGIVEQKYKDLEQVRFEYPHIIYTFKNSQFPPDMIQGLSVALDSFGEKPLIVRSSSLLEDRVGAAFSGKYKSVFIANQGSKEKRLEELMDAIAEVYASTFGPDPIEYRIERGLLDFGEEMGIMIQEVVGKQVGDYFFPAFAGVAFSQNEFRWSPRIHRKDGLVRMVPGLGTRAVDRLSNDYPIMFAPGQPDLRVNISIEDTLRYSPKYIDVINLKKNSFETIEIDQLFKKFGYDMPYLKDLVSVFENEHLRTPIASNLDLDNDDLIVTFAGLFERSPFKRQIKAILETLEDTMGMAVDVEFVHDGENLYILQCRAQSHADDVHATPIPKDIPDKNIIFSANRFISNGIVPEITHIVYIDPDSYNNISNQNDLIEVGRAVSKLNKLLPKRQFILMGPGRWGSRGDIKLGVKVKYSDINNTAALIEIARKKGNYTPDLSFGTHFFQDLVEAKIKYLPLYPDDDNIIFNERFLKYSDNLLAKLLPEYSFLENTIYLIDIPSVMNGRILKILMNADLDEAVGYLTRAEGNPQTETLLEFFDEPTQDMSWKWRYQMTENLASNLDGDKFGVKDIYIFGSTKNATAASGADVDILIHFTGNETQL
ncbi:MAG: pyruvate, phosphate dikinase, partial [Calditrichaeota bacterium]